jgi:hypothetical protein
MANELSVEPLYIRPRYGPSLRITDSLLGTDEIKLEDIMEMYELDTVKVENWWKQNINQDEVSMREFKDYIRNLDKDLKVKKNFYLNFLKLENGQPVLHSSFARGLKRSKKRSKKRGNRRSIKRSIKRSNKRSNRRKSRKHYRK